MNWESVTIKKYLEIEQLDSLREIITELDYSYKVLSILLNQDEDTIKELPEEKQTAFFNQLAFFTKEIPLENVQSIIANDSTVFNLHQDMKNLSIGEYLSIKQLQTDSPNTPLQNVLGVLVRKIVNGETEELTNDTYLSNVNYIMNMPITQLLPAYKRYNEFEVFLSQAYSELYKEDVSDDDGFSIGLEMPKSTLNVLLRLANNCIWKVAEVSKLNVLFCFNVLQHWKICDKVINRINKNKMKKIK